MQVLTFSESLRRLTELLKLQELVVVLGPIFTTTQNKSLEDQTKDQFSTILFQMSEAMTAILADPEMSELLKLLPIYEHLTAGKLSRLVTAFRTASHTAVIRSGPETHAFWELYMGAASVLQLVPLVEKTLVRPKIDVARGPAEDVLQLEVLDDDGKGIDVERLQEVLRALSELHAAVSRYVGDDSQLRIAYGDSGSDLGLGLVAKKLSLDIIRSLFRDGWSHIRFWREVGFERRIEAMSTGLQFLADVRKKASSGDIDPEVAQRVESATLLQMEKLIGNGVALREPIAQTPISRRELIAGARNLKLLRSGDDPKDDGPSEPE